MLPLLILVVAFVVVAKLLDWRKARRRTRTEAEAEAEAKRDRTGWGARRLTCADLGCWCAGTLRQIPPGRGSSEGVTLACKS